MPLSSAGFFCAPFTLAQIAEGFPNAIHVVFGNNDGDQFLLAQVAGRFPHVTLHGDFAELALNGRRIAITHYPRIGRALAQSDAYDLVCTGHSHECAVEQIGGTLLVNPGEVMGRFGRSTYALYNAESGLVEFADVEVNHQ
ncbi:metallophosphoesterase family protein [Chloroflexota bacterium]